MRLTDEIMRASDESTEEMLGKALIMATAGRLGLLPTTHPFELALNINNNTIDIESLYCLGVTKGGDLIDIQYDTRYSNYLNATVTIPEIPGVEEYILTVNAMPGQWKETCDGFEEPLYTFSLISPDNPISEHSLPIGRIVDDYGWRVDDVGFVPPCLFVKSHWKYEELLIRFSDVLATLDTKSKAAVASEARNVIGIFWPLVQQLRITVGKEVDLMTPMALLAQVQKCVSAFTCACDMDDTLELTDAKMYRSYVLAPYTYKEAYQRIKIGIDICAAIGEKVDKLAESRPRQESPRVDPARPAAPTIQPSQLRQECATSETALPVSYNIPNATICFTTDGSEPNANSQRASRTRNGFTVKFDNGFRKEKGKEEDKRARIKIIAVVDGISSLSNSYDILLHKSLKFRNAIPI